MVLCGTKNGSSMASLQEPSEAPLFLRVYCTFHRADDLYKCMITRFDINWSGSVRVCVLSVLEEGKVNGELKK